MIRLCLVALFVFLLNLPALARDCDDYRDYLHWVASAPAPFSASEVRIAGNQACVADWVSGLVVYDISVPDAPEMVGVADLGWQGPLGLEIQAQIAYIADQYGGLSAFDIDPTHADTPKLLSRIDLSNQAAGLRIAGDYAYVAADLGGFQIVDISDPHDMVVVGTLDTGYRVTDVALVGMIAYLDDWGGSRIVDVSNPEAPFIVSSPDFGPVREMRTVDLNLYVALYSGLRIYDISIPTDPHLRSQLSSPLEPMSMSIREGIAYFVTDYGSLTLADVHDPDAPAWLGSISVCSEPSGVDASNGYAFVAGDYDGLLVIDAHHTGAATPVGQWEGSGVTRDVAVAGDLAYVARDYYGFSIVDISDPEVPQTLGSVTEPYDEIRAVAVKGAYAYCAAEDDGVVVISVSTPDTPIEVGVVDTPHHAMDIVVKDDHAFVADNLGGLQVIDISDPFQPDIVSSVPSIAAQALELSGDRAYVASFEQGLAIVDISDPLHPHLMGQVDTPGLAMGVAAAGTYAFVADHDEGAHIIRCANPENPVIVASFATPTSCLEVAFADGILYAADANTGIWAIDVTDPDLVEILGVLSNRDARGVSLSEAFLFGVMGFDGFMIGHLQCPLLASIPEGSSARGPRLTLAGANPSPAAMHLAFDLPREGRVRLTVHDVTGRTVQRVMDQPLPAGSHRIAFDGRHLPAGAYYGHLITPDGEARTRWVCVR